VEADYSTSTIALRVLRKANVLCILKGNHELYSKLSYHMEAG
jgi:hypothetical protein